ncbi:hypothetical protein AAC387_Pa10g0893 [Persea americana]
MDNASPDLFCSLPDSILIFILSLIPFKEAAKTCILSKKWGLNCQKWLRTTQVEFNENLFTQEINGKTKLSTQAFLDFARRFVLYYRGRYLHEFRLKMSNPNDHRSEVEHWIKFAISKNIEVLDLDFSSVEVSEEDDGLSNSAKFVLPRFLFENISLGVLKLTSCDLKRLDFANFSALKSLCVARVELSTKSLTILVMGCPLLKTLSLEKCSGLGYIEIASPGATHLESLTINDCKPLDGAVLISADKLRSFKYFGVLTPFDIGDLGSLEDAQLDFGVEQDFFELGDVLCELFRGLYHAKALSICSYTIQAIPSGEESLRLSTALNVKHLILNTGLHMEELPGIVFLLKSCPLLETLTVKMGKGVNLNVTDALAKARLEFSNLTGRIDFTKSNQWTGSLRNLGQASCLFLMLHYKNELFTGWAGWKPSLIMDSFLGNLQEAIFTMDAETTQVIPSGEDSLCLSTALNIKHLIVNTGLHRDELPGIAFLIRSCPLLETITVKMGKEVTDALAKARLEFSNLIDRIDFTKSNQWTGNLQEALSDHGFFSRKFAGSHLYHGC